MPGYDLANDTHMVYAPNGKGGIYPVVYGEDQFGNPVLVDSSKPWYNDLLMQGVSTVGGIFGAQRFPYGYNPQNAINTQVTATQQGIGADFNISKEMLLIGGLLVAMFLFGKRGR